MDNDNPHLNKVQYSLIILISEMCISLSIYDDASSLVSTKRMEFSSSAPDSDEIAKLLNEAAQINYSHIRLIAESDNYSFVPITIFRAEDAQSLLNFVPKPDKIEWISYNTILAWSCVNVFSLRPAVHNALKRLFPHAEIEHHLSYMLTDKVRLQTGNKLYIWIRAKALDVISLENGKLKLVNSYPYSSAEDFAYHTLNVIENLALDVDKCNVTLLNSEKREGVKEVLEKYVIVNSL
jgi:hypothetical protein